MKKRQHPNCYPGTEILINKLGCRSQEQLEKAERLISAARLGTLQDQPITPDGLRKIHLHLFEQLYDWAGKYRTVTTGRGRLSFCKADYIENEIQKRFAAINSEGDLVGLSAISFAERAAEHINELNAIHPFLDGNGRTQRAFLVTLGRKAGHVIDLALVDPVAWNKASELGFYALDNAPMTKVISAAIVRERGRSGVDGAEQMESSGNGKDAKTVSKSPDKSEKAEENGNGSKATKIFVTKLELESALSIRSGPEANPVVRLLTERVDSVRFLKHRRTTNGFEPDHWVSGAEALQSLLQCFGSGQYRSLHIDTSIKKDRRYVDNPIKRLLSEALIETKSRKVSAKISAQATLKTKTQSLCL